MFKRIMSEIYMFIDTLLLAMSILWDISLMYIFGNSMQRNYVKQCKPEIRRALLAVLKYFIGLLLIAGVLKFYIL